MTRGSGGYMTRLWRPRLQLQLQSFIGQTSYRGLPSGWPNNKIVLQGTYYYVLYELLNFIDLNFGESIAIPSVADINIVQKAKDNWSCRLLLNVNIVKTAKDSRFTLRRHRVKELANKRRCVFFLAGPHNNIVLFTHI